MEDKFYKYAKLLLNKGLCINAGQPLLINAPVSAIDFVRVLTEVACELNIRDIYYDWYDDKLKHIELKYFNEEDICKSSFWNKTIHDEYAKKDAAFLFLISASDEDMEDVSQDNLKIASSHSLKSRKLYREMQENNSIDWCIAGVATKEWANLMFNNKNNDVNKLWELIFDICLVNDDNPELVWEEKMKDNANLCLKLNNLNIEKLHYTNSLGTDLTISLSKDAVWCGGSSKIKGRSPIVNMPTEELFTTPNKFLTEGIVYTSMLLVHQGVIIKDIMLEFKAGKVINYSASSGVNELKNIITLDEESSMLGEVALVDKNSKIANNNMLFYETLYDENASCHIALGRGFKECLLDGDRKSESDLEELGYNKSKNHVDIMIGTDDLTIVANTYDGKEIEIFKNGSFVI